MFWRIGAAALALAAAAPARAAPAPPTLVVAVVVDQLSADLFAQYRGHFTGGFARLAGGAVFPAGYQSHASTETCPGHATVLTGIRPGRAGIIANAWSDPRVKREDKSIYCVEDENAPGPGQVISPAHLRVPTLGDRMKAARPDSRVVAVAGKDRAAVTLAGRRADAVWWYSRGQFASYAGAAAPAAVAAANAALSQALALPRPASALPDVCRPYDLPVSIDASLSVGQGRLAREAKDNLGFQASPDADQAVLALALGLARDMKLGRGAAPDLLAIALSATDYVGHRYGAQGAEMCIQVLAVDRMLGEFFAALDAEGVDYAVVLTADHGSQDIPERSLATGGPDARRVNGTLPAQKVGRAIGEKLKLNGPVLLGEPYGVGDIWIDTALTRAQRARVLKEALAFYRAHPDVFAAYGRDEILAARIPATPPDEWSPLERVRASFDPDRSGDLYVLLKPRVSSYEAASRPYTAGHGSAWDYDRRVPILFWRRGMAHFEQPLAVETIAIMPTLAAMIGLALPPGEIDGRCLFGCR